MDIDIKELIKAAAKGFDLSNFKGDVVGVKVVENEIGNVEAGGIGIQINHSGDTGLTITDKNIKSALEELQEAKDEQGAYIMRNLDQWYAVFRVLSHFCGYPAKPKDFEVTMKNLGADDFRLPCRYESFRKVALNKLPQNISLWKQYANSADQYSMKQLKVAMKLMELLQLE